MTSPKSAKWTREETILAFELYCRTPFSKIGRNNQSIIELSKLIGRTPSAVALKMHNLAHHDPINKARNVKAMSNGSKLDLEIYKEFEQNLGLLKYQAELIKCNLLGASIEDELLGDLKDLPEGKYREQLVKTRIGQQYFRNAVLTAYGNHCCVTGLYDPTLLIASHIKPWVVSDEKTERTNPCNGLCLNPFHDKAFDSGLITVNKNYEIIVSSRLKEAQMDDNTRNWFMAYNKKTIKTPDKFLPSPLLLEYHNDVIFQR